MLKNLQDIYESYFNTRIINGRVSIIVDSQLIPTTLSLVDALYVTEEDLEPYLNQSLDYLLHCAGPELKRLITRRRNQIGDFTAHLSCNKYTVALKDLIEYYKYNYDFTG